MQDVQESQNTVQAPIVEADQPPKPGVPAPEGFYYRLVGRKGHKEWKLYKKPDTRKMREAKQSKVQNQPAQPMASAGGVEAFDRDKYLQEMRQSQESSNKQILDQLVQLNSYWSQFQNQQQKLQEVKQTNDSEDVKEDAEKSQDAKKVVKKAVKKPVEQEPPTAEALGRGPQEEIEQEEENGDYEYQVQPPQRQRGNPQLQSHPLFKRNRY